jgi:hypothetical protein
MPGNIAGVSGKESARRIYPAGVPFGFPDKLRPDRALPVLPA